MVLRLHQHSIGYTGDCFYATQPTNSIQSTEGTQSTQITEKYNKRTQIQKHSKSPSLH